MVKNTLNEIIEKKKYKVNKLKKTISLNELNEKISVYNNFFDFKKKIIKNISQNKFSLIAEIKKASPSAGVIINNYDPVKIANIYNPIPIRYCFLVKFTHNL